MSQIKPPPFTLPVEPVDRYELRWYRIDPYSDEVRIDEHRAVYFVDATWADVCGDDGKSPGRPFVDQWQIFDNGRFEGRNVGWSAMSKPQEYWDGAFKTRAEASALRIKILENRLRAQEEKVAELTAKLVKARAEIES